jgi:hypothetical protein
MATKTATIPAKKTARTPVPKDEAKSAKFIRVGNQRHARAVKAIQGLAKLGGNGFERTREQIDTIYNSLKTEIDNMYTRLDPAAKASAKNVVAPIL